MERPGATTFQGNPLTLIGEELKPGQPAPDFTVLTEGLQPYSLDDGSGRARIVSVIASIDTPVCDAQTRRFNEEVAQLGGVDILTVSVDLPFALARWRASAGVENVTMLSDHRDLSFGRAFGILVSELRVLGRGLFVLDADNNVVHAEYVKELTDHPDYDGALAAARGLSGS